MSTSRRLRLNAFSMNCVSHIHHGQWTRADTRQLEYAGLDPWIELAQILERGKFDALFLADVIGTYDSYRAAATSPSWRACRSRSMTRRC
jgi:alkanesulfonate monooxygenase SsuD/methylene tetrahydromethanopterin reductase-like flavin-dependent oxidoreductase (luciferase family)